jgi:hypothetical protein
MPLTRREVCTMLSTVVPVVFAVEAMAAPQDNPLPSATFPFDTLPINVSNNAQIRPILKGKLATGGVIGSARNDTSTWRCAAWCAPSHSFGNVAHSRGNG